MPVRHIIRILRPAFLYLALSTIYILIADALIDTLAETLHHAARLATIKAILLISLTAILFGYFLVREYRKHLSEVSWTHHQAVALESSATPVLIADDHDHIRWANTACTQLLTCPLTHLYDQPTTAILPDPPDADPGARRQALQTQGTYEYRVRLIVPHGVPRVLRVTATTVFHADGSIQGIISTIRDITDILDAQAALRASEAKYHIVADNAQSWEYWLDPTGQFQYVSPSCQSLSGYTPEDFLASPHLLTEIILPEDRPLWETCHTATQRGLPHTIEFRIRTKVGEVRWLSHTCRPIYDTDGTYLGLRGSQDSIDERMRAQRELAARSQQLEALHTVAIEITQELTLTRLLTLITQRLVQLLPCTNSAVFFLDATRRFLEPQAAAGPSTMLTTRRPLSEGLLGFAATHARGVCENNYPASPYAVPQAVHTEQVTALLAEPLLVQGQLLGLLVATQTNHRRFSSDQEMVFRAFAAQATTAIENARLYEAAQHEITDRRNAEVTLQQRTQQLDAVRTIGLELTRDLDLSHLLERVVQEAARLLGAIFGTVWLWDAAGEHLVPRAFVGHDRTWLTPLRLRLGEGVSGMVAKQRVGLIVTDVHHSPYCAAIFRHQTRSSTVMAEPLLYQDRMVGVIALDRQATDPPFTTQDQETLRLFTAQAAIAIENARLYEATQRELGIREMTTRALERRTKQLETIRLITSELTRELDLSRLLTLITQHAADLLTVPAAGILLWDAEAGVLRPAATVGFPAELTETVTIPLGVGTPGLAAATQAPVIANEYQSHPKAFTPLQDLGVTAGLAHPLLYNQTLIGAIAVNHVTPGARFTDADSALLGLLAQHAAIAIHAAQTFRDEQERRKQLESLRTISAELIHELDRSTLLQNVLTHAIHLTGASAGAIRLWDPATRTLTPAAQHHYAPYALHEGEGVSGTIAATRTGLLVNNFPTSPYNTSGHPQNAHHQAVLGEPLLYRDQLVGVIVLARRQAEPFTATDAACLQLLTPHATIAIHHAQVFAELQSSYQTLQHAQEELLRTERLRALGQLSAGIAHDLNNVLTAIIGPLELLQLTQTSETTAPVRLALAAAQQAAHVVRQLRTFSAVPNQSADALAPVALRTILTNALEFTRPSRETRHREGHRIDVQTTIPGHPYILGNAAEVEEACINLILNAIDAMPTGGTLTVATRSLPASPTATPPALDAAPRIELTLQDTGIGIPSDVQNRIFDPFFTTKGARGTGLGLAMVQSLMKRHGAIAVNSTPGQGTTFTLTFRHADPPAEAPAIALTAERSAHPSRILLVDDQLSVRKSLQGLLTLMGHTVIEAESAPDALAQFRTAAPDLVITDLTMHPITGLQLAHTLRQSSRIPIILHTGDGTLDFQEALGDGTLTAILHKPVRFASLFAMVEQHTARTPSA